MTGSFPVADHLRCLASASSDILTDIPFLVTAFWDRTRSGLAGLGGCLGWLGLCPGGAQQCGDSVLLCICGVPCSPAFVSHDIGESAGARHTRYDEG